jgi:hypothetical protein
MRPAGKAAQRGQPTLDRKTGSGLEEPLSQHITISQSYHNTCISALSFISMVALS